MHVNDRKRASYHLQVAVCAMYIKLNDAYYQSESELPILEQLQKGEKESEMHFYWKLTLLSANPKRWLNTLHQFVGNSPLIV